MQLPNRRERSCLVVTSICSTQQRFARRSSSSQVVHCRLNMGMETSEQSRAAWLGRFAVLSDELICNLLELLAAEDLARLSCVSRVFYIFCNEEPLWMKLCFRNLDGLLKYDGSWRATALERLGKRQSASLGANIHAEGFSSLFLYRRWYRCNVNMSAFEIDHNYIHRRNDLSAEEFAENYERKKPVLLRCSTDKWPAMINWSLEYLSQHYGTCVFKVAQNTCKKILMRLKDYISYMRQQHDEEPLYIFDAKFGEIAPGLVQDYEVPKLFEEDLLGYMDKADRPPFRWLVIGPVRSGASWHVDPALTSAWNTLISGRKRWAFYPPGRVPPSVIVHADEDEGEVDFDSPTSLQWWLDVYPALKDEDKPLECIQFPGETIYVPSGWWHCVLNLDNSLAVTQNFVNKANFELVCLDLSPGHLHKAAARAGRLAYGPAFVKSFGPKEATTLPPQWPDWSLNVDFLASFVTHHKSHHVSNSIRSDFFLTQPLRKWLWKLWKLRPDLKKQIWKSACMAFDAQALLARIGSICDAHNLPQPTEMERLPLGNGSNPVFIVGSNVIKLCLDEAFEDKALDALASELQFYAIVENAQSPLKNFIPEVIASGVIYYESGQYKATVWDGKNEPKCKIHRDKSRKFCRARWNQAVLRPEYLACIEDHVSNARHTLCPYIVTNRCDGWEFACLREKMQGKQILSLANILGHHIRKLHDLPMPDMCHLDGKRQTQANSETDIVASCQKHAPQTISKEWTLFTSMMRRQHEHARDRLEQWECAPPHLIRQVEDYLPSDPVELLGKVNPKYAPMFKLVSPVWLHMDVTDENLQIVLGPPAETNQIMLHVIKEEPEEENSDVVKSCRLLDFGDVCLGDPLYDLVGVYLDVFRGNPEFLDRFLASYTSSLSSNHTTECKGTYYSHDLPYRAMCYTILHEENAVGVIFKTWKDLKTADSWKDVEEKVWGVLVKYQNTWNHMH